MPGGGGWIQSKKAPGGVWAESGGVWAESEGVWAESGSMAGFARACSWVLPTAAPRMLHCIQTQCSLSYKSKAGRLRGLQVGTRSTP